LLEVDVRAVQDDTLYRCLDLLLPLKKELFGHLRRRWCDLFGATYQVLRYDLTSTYFECDIPEDDEDPRRFGYLAPYAKGLEVEKFWVLCLNRKNRLKKLVEVTSGTATGSLVHPREAFRAAIQHGATAIVCAHISTAWTTG
jgi:hypothetical protein